MKWFKHDSNASLDAKLQRLRLRYGMEGYGLYWFCLESIARNVEAHNLTFELEEDSELIAAATSLHVDQVQEMMVFMCDLGLFEDADGRITCLKMATRTDEYTQKLLRSPETVRRLSGATPEKVPPIRIEEKRIDKNRKRGASRQTPLPKNFAVDKKMIAWVEEKYPKLDWASATEKWQTAMKAQGRKYADWRSAWQNGMGKADEWRLEKQPANNFAELREAIDGL